MKAASSFRGMGGGSWRRQSAAPSRWPRRAAGAVMALLLAGLLGALQLFGVPRLLQRLLGDLLPGWPW